MHAEWSEQTSVRFINILITLFLLVWTICAVTMHGDYVVELSEHKFYKLDNATRKRFSRIKPFSKKDPTVTRL